MKRESQQRIPHLSNRILWYALLAGLSTCLCATQAIAEHALSADSVFEDANIYTGIPARGMVQAVAIRDGKIVALGSARDVQNLVSPTTQVVDLQRRTMLPGFYDCHAHVHTSADPRVQDWSRTTSKQDLLAAIAHRTKELSAGDWVIGSLIEQGVPSNWRSGILQAFPKEQLPVLSDLDAVAPNQPVVLDYGDITIVNSAVMRRGKIDALTPDPPLGAVDRDHGGNPTGWFRGFSGKRLATRAMPPRGAIPDDEIAEQFHQQLKAFLSLGITSVNIAVLPPDLLHVLQRTYQKWGSELPRATVQPFLSPGSDFYDDPEQGTAKALEELKELPFVTGFGDDHLRVGAIKMQIDGASSMFQSTLKSAGDKSYYGVDRIPQASLQSIVSKANLLGWQIAIHAMGDEAVQKVVDVFAKALDDHPREDPRFYVHHVFMTPPPDTLAKMEKYSIGACIQPNSNYALSQFLKFQPAILASVKPPYQPKFYETSPAVNSDRFATLEPLRTLINHNIRVAFGSDGAPYGPLLGIYAAVTRKGVDGKVYGAEEAVSVSDAIRMYTLEPAYFNFLEKERGTIETGKVADFVVLDDDITRTSPDKIKNIQVDMTIISGRIVYKH